MTAGHVALLTPPGPGAIAVIRLSGPGVPAFAERHLAKPPRVGRCVHSDLVADGETIDDVVAVLTPAGDLDLNVHGGPWVIEATLRAADASGFMRVDSLEDTDDEIEGQVLADLPRVRSRPLLRLLAAQPAAWAAMLGRNDVAELLRAFEDWSLERALAVPTVAIVGPPNVGKSTLANALFAREHSITADRPGTTRDWVGEFADLNGLVVRLIDTPGVRQTADAIEAEAIRRAGVVTGEADCVVIAVDGSRPAAEAEQQAVDCFVSQIDPERRQIVHTKFDLPPGSDIAADVRVSAKTGSGLDNLIERIRRSCGINDLVTPSARCWTDEQRYKVGTRLKSLGASIAPVRPYNRTSRPDGGTHDARGD